VRKAVCDGAFVPIDGWIANDRLGGGDVRGDAVGEVVRCRIASFRAGFEMADLDYSGCGCDGDAGRMRWDAENGCWSLGDAMGCASHSLSHFQLLRMHKNR
jgi:hypothetical protein